MSRNDERRSFPVSLPAPDGLVPTVVHLPERTPAPVVVCCHGLFSYKDSSKFVAIGERFSEAGMAVVRFDFAGCGESRAMHGRNLLLSRGRDLKVVLTYVRAQPWADGRIGLLGSSMGGYVALLTAASEQGSITAVVCWATPFDLSQIAAGLEESEDFKATFPPGYALGEPENLRKLPSVPNVLVIHGQEDETVPWRDGVAIYRRVGDSKRLLLLRTADHRLLDPQWRQIAMEESLGWFREHGLGEVGVRGQDGA